MHPHLTTRKHKLKHFKLFPRTLPVIKLILRPFLRNWLLAKLIRSYVKQTRTLVLHFIKRRTEPHFWTSPYFFQHHQLNPAPPYFFLHLSSKLTTRKAIHKSSISKREATGSENKSLLFCCQPDNFLKVKCLVLNRGQPFLFA